jgi:ABC-type transport system involved in cytochrome bd biosynthesis fused ATPase/permease subunit
MSQLRDKGKGVVLVTHQLQYLEFADKILVLDKNGKNLPGWIRMT